jgi:hypothetical protein
MPDLKSIFLPGTATPTCPKCRGVIPSEDVNVATDVAFCRRCNASYSLSSLTHGTVVDENIDVANPPAGAWYRGQGVATVIGATHRSLGSAAGLLFIALFWNGIVSVFVLLALAATIHNLGWTVPTWFPAPRMNGGGMGVGITIFLWIFLTPFIAIGLAMMGAFVSCLGGKTEVEVTGAETVIFTGMGALGWRRRFETSQAADVRIDDKRWRDSDGDNRRKTNIVIELKSGKVIRFGSMLTEERRKFVAGAVRKALLR